jgi:hypothetical protein
MRKEPSKPESYFWSISQEVREHKIAKVTTKRDSKKVLRLIRVF